MQYCLMQTEGVKLCLASTVRQSKYKQSYSVVNLASKIIGKRQKQLSCIYEIIIRKKAIKIAHDPSHPLFREFELLPSGGRYRVPRHSRNI